MTEVLKHDSRAHDGAAKIQEGVRELKDATVDKFGQIKDAAMERAAALKDAAWDRAVEARNVAMETGRRGANLFHQYCDETEALIRARPLQSLAIAGGIGFILGAMLLRRARRAYEEEREMM